jgi:transposase-like protein
MSSVTEGDGMAKRASQAGDARTSDRTSALRLGTELNTCGKRRRWTPGQKHKIVADGMEPDVSAAIVAGRHGISTGQFYAWRQQLLLRGALDAGADSLPNLASIDAKTSAPRVEPAIPAPPELGTPTAAAAPVAPVLPDDRVGVTRPDGVAGRLDEDCGVEHALTTNRRSVLNSPRGARADCGQADRSGDTAPAGAWTYALRRFRHWDRVGRIGWSPVPGEQLLTLVALGAAGDQTFEHVGQVGEWIDAVQLCCLCRPPDYAERFRFPQDWQ